MERPLIFLDIDGVLNDHEWDEDADLCLIHQRCVREFNWLVRELGGADIVVSSAWRYMVLRGSMTVEGFGNMLRTHGVTSQAEFIDTTKSDETITTRSEQVREWVDRNNRSRWIVLDDMPFSCPIADRFIAVDGATGLTRADCERAITVMEVATLAMQG
jgi:hypothetical protein